jgi:hypothetical protein
MSLCQLLPEFPIVEIIKAISLISMYSISIIYPLTKKKVYHMLLPTGRAYDLTKTMRDFLL